MFQTRESIEKQIQRFAFERAHRKLLEQSVAFKARKGEIDHAELKALLDKETDQTLFDWMNVLNGRPMAFPLQTKLPEWLDDIKQHPKICNDLVSAIFERISDIKPFM